MIFHTVWAKYANASINTHPNLQINWQIIILIFVLKHYHTVSSSLLWQYTLISFFWYWKKDHHRITQPNSSSTPSTSAHSRFPQRSKSCQSCHFPFTPCLHSNVSLQTKINLQYGVLNVAFFTKVKPIWQQGRNIFLQQLFVALRWEMNASPLKYI